MTVSEPLGCGRVGMRQSESVMRPLAIALILGSLAAGPALAQSSPSAASSGLVPAGPGAPAGGSVGSTATGGLPEKTGATTAVGQTKPPGTAVGDREGTRPDLEAKSRELDRKIDRGICIGCK